MSKIMELADAYAAADAEEHYEMDFGDQKQFNKATYNKSQARAALQAEVEKLEAESNEMALIGVRSVADVLALREKLASVEKYERRNQKLLYGFMLDWNAIGPLDAAANLARGIKEAVMEATK